MQLNLLQWVKFYSQVYEMPPTDRPAQHVIDDDRELDRWFEAFLQQAAAQASLQKAQTTGKTGGTIPAPRSALKKFGG